LSNCALQYPHGTVKKVHLKNKNMKLIKGIAPEFIDARGAITMVLDENDMPVKSVLLITCTKGAVRANHFHKEDSHWAFMLTGKMRYTEAPVGAGDDKKEVAIVEAGDMVYSPPMVMHAMEFLEDSVFLAFATKSRKDGAYEDDTVRVNLV